MRTHAGIAAHPIHPMLVAIPIGLWSFSLACDFIHAWGAGEAWRVAANFSLVGGLVGALLAAIPGFIDMFSPEGGPGRVALLHMGTSLAVVVLYGGNAWLRSRGATDAPMMLSAAGIALLLVSGWLGGRMAGMHGLAVAGSDARPSRHPQH